MLCCLLSYELVAGLVGLLHGAGDQPQPAGHEYAQLASLLGITQRYVCVSILGASLQPTSSLTLIQILNF